MAEKTIPIRFTREELILIQDALDILDPDSDNGQTELLFLKNKLDKLWMEAWVE